MTASDTTRKQYREQFLAELKVAAEGARESPSDHVPGMRSVVISTYNPESRSFRVILDASKQVLGLDAVTDTQWAFPEVGATTAAAIYPSFVRAGLGNSAFLSASVLGLKAKAFDDGLYAAMELGVEAGIGKLPDRKAFLRNLIAGVTTSHNAVIEPGPEAGVGKLAALKADLFGPGAATKTSDNGDFRAAATLTAAARLAGERLDLTPQIDAEAKKLEQAFRADEMHSKPLGFYTWSEELTQVFQRDRILKAPLDEASALALARALANDASLADPYATLVGITERLTNPLAFADLRQTTRAFAAGKESPFPGRVALFPPSRSHETELINKLYSGRSIPDGFNLADEMVKRLQKGTLDLMPRPESGWLDHQVYALEPLVIPEQMPEGKHLLLGDAYRKDLLGLFKSLLALTRETHVKQLEDPVDGMDLPGSEIVLRVQPGLSLEPLATYYLRRARSYRFISRVLEDACGSEALAELRRLTAAGPVNLSLREELQLMGALFYGAYLRVCEDLAMTPETHEGLGFGKDPAVDKEIFERWRAELEDDPDLGSDVRMMVPVFYDIERGKHKVWAILGVAEKPLEVSYRALPVVKELIEITDRQATSVPPNTVRVEFGSEVRKLGYVVTAEVYVSRLMNRVEFQAHCDRYKSEEVILANLE